MDRRTLGRNGPTVSALGPGCMARARSAAVSSPARSPEARKANQDFVDQIGRIAERKRATKAQVALAWLRAQKP